MEKSQAYRGLPDAVHSLTMYEAGDRILPPPSEHLENTITFEIFDSFTTNRICLKFKRLI